MLKNSELYRHENRTENLKDMDWAYKKTISGLV